MVEIMVKDTGIGIKAEDQHKLFKPFSQVNSLSSKKSQGTGLGLSLVKQIVNLHGGYVWFRSEEGEGSTFAFVIPITAKKCSPAAIKKSDYMSNVILRINDESRETLKARPEDIQNTA